MSFLHLINFLIFNYNIVRFKCLQNNTAHAFAKILSSATEKVISNSYNKDKIHFKLCNILQDIGNNWHNLGQDLLLLLLFNASSNLDIFYKLILLCNTSLLKEFTQTFYYIHNLYVKKKNMSKGN